MLVTYQVYTKMHGQKNIKFQILLHTFLPSPSAIKIKSVRSNRNKKKQESNEEQDDL